jgi:hypothetical protein
VTAQASRRLKSLAPRHETRRTDPTAGRIAPAQPRFVATRYLQPDFNLRRLVDSAQGDASSPEIADGHKRGVSVRAQKPALESFVNYRFGRASSQQGCAAPTRNFDVTLRDRTPSQGAHTISSIGTDCGCATSAGGTAPTGRSRRRLSRCLHASKTGRRRAAEPENSGTIDVGLVFAAAPGLPSIGMVRTLRPGRPVSSLPLSD